MTKTELITAVAESTGTTKKDAERIVNATFETIAAQMAAGEKVQIAGFGIFETKDREARTGRNPITGEAVQIAAKRAPAFKAGKALKDRVAE